jgi:hypothetical protein
MSERLWIPLTLHRPPVYGPFIRVFVDTVIAVEGSYGAPAPGSPVSKSEHSLVHFVGGSTLPVCESPAEITAAIAAVTKGEYS